MRRKNDPPRPIVVDPRAVDARSPRRLTTDKAMQSELERLASIWARHWLSPELFAKFSLSVRENPESTFWAILKRAGLPREAIVELEKLTLLIPSRPTLTN